MPEDPQPTYISLREAAKYSDCYSQEYLSLRARQGKLKAVKIGRNWVTKKEWVDEYLKQVREYKTWIPDKKRVAIQKAQEKIEREKKIPEPTAVSRPASTFSQPVSSRAIAVVVALVFVLASVGTIFGYPYFEPGLKSAGNFIKQSSTEVATDVRELTSDIGEGIVEVGDNLSESISNFGLDVSAGAGLTTEELGENLARSRQFVAREFRGFVAGVSEGVNRTLVEPVKNFALNIANQFTRYVSQDIRAIKNFAIETGQKIKKVPQKVVTIFKKKPEIPEQILTQEEIEKLIVEKFVTEEQLKELQQRIEKLKEEGLPAKEIIKEVTKITQITPVKETTKEVTKIDDKELKKLKSQIAEIQEWETDIETLQTLTSKLQTHPPYTQVTTAPVYIGSQGIQVGGAGILASLGVSGMGSIGGGFGVGGSATLGSDYNDKLTVNATAEFVNPVTITDTLTVGSGALTVDSSGNLSTTGSLTAATSTITTLTTTENLTIGGDLTVSGAQTYSGSATTTGDFAVQGTTTLATTTITRLGVGTTTPSYPLTVVGNVWGSGNIILTGTIDTGQGATEVYLMNQNITTTSSPTFANLTVSGTATTTDLIVTSTSTLGTITSGTWQGATITDAYITKALTIDSSGSIDAGSIKSGAITTQYGGTGQDWSTTSIGSIPYFSATGTLSTLAPATSSYFLQTQGPGQPPTWAEVIQVWSDSGTALYPTNLTRKVGIGTTTPQAMLHIESTTEPQLIVGYDGSKYFELNITSQGSIQFRPSIDSAQAFQFQTKGGTATVLDIDTSSQLVGLGTTTPARKLDVSGSARIWDQAGGGITTLELKAAASQSTNPLLSWQDSSGNILGVISNQGYFGFGTTTPPTPLYVVGTSTLVGNLDISGTITSATWQGSEITDTYISNTLTLTGGSIDNVPIGASTSSTGAFSTLSVSATTTLTGNLDVTGTTTISNALGIGTTTPQHTLDVGGKIYLKADGVNWGELKVEYTSSSPAGYYPTYAP